MRHLSGYVQKQRHCQMGISTRDLWGQFQAGVSQLDYIDMQELGGGMHWLNKASNRYKSDLKGGFLTKCGT